MATIWQKAHLNVNDRTAYPVELLEPCAQAGYACVQVMLNPFHPSTSLEQVPLTYIKQIRDLGMKAFGFVWADDFTSPDAMFEFVRGWREHSIAGGCAITGFVLNCEDGWEAHDQAGERWSERFVTLFRADPLTRKLSLAINLYHGSKGCDLPSWQRAGARCYVQTFKEGLTHEWPVDGYKGPLAQYGFTHWVKVKANLGCYQPYPSRAEQIAAMVRGGVVGYSSWYAEGSGDPHDILIPLLNEARAVGVCY